MVRVCVRGMVASDFVRGGSEQGSELSFVRVAGTVDDGMRLHKVILYLKGESISGCFLVLLRRSKRGFFWFFDKREFR